MPQVLNQSLPPLGADLDVVLSGPTQVYTLRITKGLVLNIGKGDHHTRSDEVESHMRVVSVRAGPEFVFKVIRVTTVATVSLRSEIETTSTAADYGEESARRSIRRRLS